MVKSLSVVVPAYNEEKNVAACLRKIHAVLKTTNLDWEVILVDDGSTDKTGAIAKTEAKRMPRLKVITNSPNRGYGGSLRAGFAACTKDFIAFFPADNQFDFEEIHLMLAKQESTQADIVGGVRVNRHDPPHRRFLGWLWNYVFVGGLFGFLSSDIDCGFKLFRRSLLDHIHLTADRGAMIDTQLFASSRARGFTVAEVPLTHLPRTTGHSTGATPEVIVQSLLDLAKYWWTLKQEIYTEKGKQVFHWELIAIFLVLILAAFLRLYKIDGYMTFLGDEGRDVSVVRDMILGRKFTLLGPGTSIGNIYLGPLYYYLMIPPLALWHLNPVGPAIQVAVLGVITVGLLWWVGRQWFARLPALLVALLYSLSPVVITYSHSSWNPNIMPFFALVAMYGIWKVWRINAWRWLVVSSIAFAFVVNSHYLGLLLLPSMGLFIFLSDNKFHNKKYIFSGVLAFVLLMSPLFFFDMRHDWSNTKQILHFFTDRQTTVNIKPYKALPNIWPIWVDINSSLLAGKNLVIAQWTTVVLLFSLLLYAFTKRTKDFWFTLSWLGFGLIGLGLYKQHIYDHYYGFLFPVPFLLLGFALDLLPKKVIFLSCLLVVPLVVVMVNANPFNFPPNNQLAHTREVADFIKAESKGPFNLALLSKSNYDASYRYFLSLNMAKYYSIHDRLTDQLFVVCEDPACQPINNPMWEVAAFGWAKIDRQWEFPWGVKLYRLIHNPSGK